MREPSHLCPYLSYLSLFFSCTAAPHPYLSYIIVPGFSVLNIILSTENAAQLVERLPVVHGDSEFSSRHSHEPGRHDGACLWFQH